MHLNGNTTRLGRDVAWSTRVALFVGIALLALTAAIPAAESAAGASFRVTALGDLSPSPNGSFPERFTRVGDRQFFRADDAIHGVELWVTDGTPEGTRLVEDINPGTGSSYPGSFYFGTMVGSGSRLFFFANDGVHGEELWVSDGTADGTAMVRDAAPGPQGSVPAQLVPFKDGVMFAMYAPATGETGLWRSDGTEAGTVLVKAISAGGLAAVGDAVFFSGDDGVHGRELWATDGTTGGTRMVKDIQPPFDIYKGDSNPSLLTDVNGRLFFTADDRTHGNELWMSDGTEAGTVRLSDIWPGSTRTPIEKLTDVGGTLYFVAYRPTYGESIWKSDGTEAGTMFVWDGDAPAWSLGLDQLTGLGDTLLFRYVYDPSGPELWRSDGTESGTSRVADINASWGSFPEWLTVVGPTLYFQANDGVHGRELWATDGTEAGTVLVADLNPGAGESAPVWLSGDSESVFFGATDGTHGWEPYKVARRVDTAPPTLVVPSEVTVDATSPEGAVVVYSVSASDNVDPNPTVSCAPPSGSTFPIGDTTVSCTATDEAGNTSAPGTFTVHVKGAEEQVADVIAVVDGYQLGKLGSSLHDKLVTVQRFLAAGKPQQAMENLASFISQVDAQRGKGLTPSQADALTSAAQRITNVIGA